MSGQSPWTMHYGEYWCVPCSRGFRERNHLFDHLHKSSYHDWCEPCDREFESANALLSHRVNSSRHGWCTFCDDDFDDREGLRVHRIRQHAPCDGCNSVFATELGRHEHARQSHESRYCGECRRIFQNANNLNAHLNSAVHRPANTPCPGGGCSRSFINHAALVLHLESGTCPSGMTIRELNRRVAQLDQGNFVTNPQRRIEYGGNNDAPPATYLATSATWNSARNAYCCYFCPSTFRTLSALNNHLKSPKHTLGPDKLYRCSPLLKGCQREFSQLSSLIQHMENGGCGVRRFTLRAPDQSTSQVVLGFSSLPSSNMGMQPWRTRNGPSYFELAGKHGYVEYSVEEAPWSKILTLAKLCEGEVTSVHALTSAELQQLEDQTGLSKTTIETVIIEEYANLCLRDNYVRCCLDASEATSYDKGCPNYGNTTVLKNRPTLLARAAEALGRMNVEEIQRSALYHGVLPEQLLLHAVICGHRAEIHIRRSEQTHQMQVIERLFRVSCPPCYTEAPVLPKYHKRLGNALFDSLLVKGRLRGLPSRVKLLLTVGSKRL